MEVVARAAARAACLAGALTWAGCARRETGAGTPAVGTDSTVTARSAELVRRQYRSQDAIAAGAWTWVSPRGPVWVLVDVQSTIEGIVQARADLWGADSAGIALVGRSQPMPAAAEIGAWAFEDLTGDGIPDLFGYVADSAGVTYPVFIPGGRGALGEEIEVVAPSWVFPTDEDHTPQLLRGAAPCALQLWADVPAPDNGPAGWRYLAIIPEGHLAPPSAVAPVCAPGLQPAPSRP
jgi:hypothetical protein